MRLEELGGMFLVQESPLRLADYKSPSMSKWRQVYLSIRPMRSTNFWSCTLSARRQHDATLRKPSSHCKPAQSRSSHIRSSAPAIVLFFSCKLWSFARCCFTNARCLCPRFAEGTGHPWLSREDNYTRLFLRNLDVDIRWVRVQIVFGLECSVIPELLSAGR